MKIPKPRINSDILLGLAEEKIKKLEEFISMHNVAIKNHTAKKGEIISGLKYKVTDLQEMLLERDNYVKKLRNLKSEDVKVIDDLKENLLGTEEALELARDKIRSLNNSLQMDNDFFVKTLDEKNAEINVLTTRSNSVTTERDALNDKYIETLNNLEAMQGELNRIDKQPNKCECPDKISKLEGKVQRLESNLAIEKHNNHDLINHINTLQVYKSKYFKTVETLKVHLPN